MKTFKWLCIVLAMTVIPVACDQPENGGKKGGTTTVAVTGITLDIDECDLHLHGIDGDKTKQLTATVLPDNATDKTVSWESEDEDIVTVSSDGLITAVGVGDATITARAGDYFAECSVVVLDDTPISVEDVTMDATLTIDFGETGTLTATITPNDASNKRVKWAVTDPTVVTLSAAAVDHAHLTTTFTLHHEVTVHSLKAGETKITVITEEDDFQNEFSDECTVTVNPPPPVPFRLVIRNLNTGTLNANTTPSNEALLTWTGGNTWTGSQSLRNNESSVGNINAAASANNSRNGTIAYVYPPIHGAFTFTVKANVTTAGTYFAILRHAEPEKYVFSTERIATFLGLARLASAMRFVFPQSDGTTLRATDPGGDAVTTGAVYTWELSWNQATQSTTLKTTNDSGTVFQNVTLGPGSANISGSPVLNNAIPWYPALQFGGSTITISEINVTLDSDYVGLQSISLPPTLSVALAGTATPAVTYTPNNATYQGVTYESSNTAVATVGKFNGLVTGVSAGNATITATSAVGNKTATCAVTVQ